MVQLYTRTEGGPAPRPVRELRGFKRLSLAPGERQTARSPCRRASWAPTTGTWPERFNLSWPLPRRTYRSRVSLPSWVPTRFRGQRTLTNKGSDDKMKKPQTDNDEDELRPEYDLATLLKGAVRGKYVEQYRQGTGPGPA